MNTIYTHPGQPQMQVEVILPSVGKYAPPIYTLRLRYPRIIHAEIMTHRVFSRNARSSRAVPVKTMLKEIREIPFVPWHWGKNQKGMQASEECNEGVTIHYIESDGFAGEMDVSREGAWLHLRDQMVEGAEAFDAAGYHKQVVNRLIEPFSWIDVLITATDWSNFLWLRDHKDAEPHLQDLARLVRQAIDESPLILLDQGQWHLPYITDKDYWELHKAWRSVEESNRVLCKISAARCARISYAPFDGNASYEAELARYDSLISSDRIHASPVEHQATPDEQIRDREGIWQWDSPHLHGNFTGWIQNRKLIPNESA